MIKGMSIPREQFDSELEKIKASLDPDDTALRMRNHWWLLSPVGKALEWRLYRVDATTTAEAYPWRVGRLKIRDDGTFVFTPDDEHEIIFNLPYNQENSLPLRMAKSDVSDAFHIAGEKVGKLKYAWAKKIMEALLEAEEFAELNRIIAGAPLEGLTEPPSDDALEEITRILNE